MALEILFSVFLQRIAIGAATVFAVLLAIYLKMPRRAAVVSRRIVS